MFPLPFGHGKSNLAVEEIIETLEGQFNKVLLDTRQLHLEHVQVATDIATYVVDVTSLTKLNEAHVGTEHSLTTMAGHSSRLQSDIDVANDRRAVAYAGHMWSLVAVCS